MAPSRTARFTTVIKALPQTAALSKRHQQQYPYQMPSGKGACKPEPLCSGTAPPGGERTAAACPARLTLRAGEARPAGGREGTKYTGKEGQEGEKHPGLIYSLSLTFLPVLIMKMQPTAPSRCHNRKLIEYLYKPQRNHCFEEKQNLTSHQSSGLPCRQHRTQNPILKLKELSVGSNYVTPEHQFFLEREAGCWGHSSAPPLGWTLLPQPQPQRHPGRLLRTGDQPAVRLSISAPRHAKGRRKAGALQAWA